MSNVKDMNVKSVEVTLSDSKVRSLKYTLNSLAELEDRYGSVEKAFKALESHSLKALRCVLWAGLIWEDPTLTETEVGALIDTSNLEGLMGSMNVAMDHSMPVPPPKKPAAKSPNK